MGSHLGTPGLTADRTLEKCIPDRISKYELSLLLLSSSTSVSLANVTVLYSPSTWDLAELWCCVDRRQSRRLWWTKLKNSVGGASRLPSTGFSKAMVRGTGEGGRGHLQAWVSPSFSLTLPPLQAIFSSHPCRPLCLVSDSSLCRNPAPLTESEASPHSRHHFQLL